MLKLPDPKDLRDESPSDADVSSDVSSADSLLLDEDSKTSRSSQGPAQGLTSHLEKARVKRVRPVAKTRKAPPSSFPRVEATMLKSLDPDKYGLEDQWKEIVTTSRWNGRMALRALNSRNQGTRQAASQNGSENNKKRKRESEDCDLDATKDSEGPGEGPSTGQGGSLARSKTSKGKQKQVDDSDSSHQGAKKKKAASAKPSTENKEDRRRSPSASGAEAWYDWD